jgi:hypothetical protein
MLSRAVADRIGDPDERVLAAGLIFFLRYPTADGIAQVIARATSDLGAVGVQRAVPEDDYRPSLWDVLLAVLRQRTDQDPARDVVDLVREVMLRPVGDRDPLLESLRHSWEAEAFHLDDARWMAEHIVALEVAGHGRWKPILNLVVAFARNDAKHEDMIVIAGVALIASGRVPAADLRAWIKQRASRSDGWALVLEASLATAS